MMHSLFTSGWSAPAPSAVPSFTHQLTVTIASFVIAVSVHATVLVLGI